MIRVQGYALPWNKPAEVDGLIETVAPNAVQPSASNITLLFGDHETYGRQVFAQTKDRTLRFFCDDYGLGFTAYLDDSHGSARAAARAIGSAEVSQASVNFTSMHRRADGRVIWGAIDHVALVYEGAYRDTGCWLASQSMSDRAPWLVEMSKNFNESIIANSRRRPDPVQDLGRPAISAGIASNPAAPRSHHFAALMAHLANKPASLAQLQGRLLGFPPSVLLARLRAQDSRRGSEPVDALGR